MQLPNLVGKTMSIRKQTADKPATPISEKKAPLLRRRESKVQKPALNHDLL